MSKPNQNMRSMRAWQRRYDALTHKTEDLTASFELRDVDGENSVHNCDFRGKQER